MTARLLATVAALSLIFSTCFAEVDPGKDFDEKAAKAEKAQLEADWAKLDAYAAFLRFEVAEREDGWRSYLGMLDELAARRYAARSDEAELEDLSEELDGLLKKVEAFTATNGFFPPRVELRKQVTEYDHESLFVRLQELIDSAEDGRGENSDYVKAGRERLRDYERAKAEANRYWEIEYDYDRVWEATELLLEYTHEYDAALKEQDAAEAAHKAAVKALDDHLTNAPGADATDAERDAHDEKARELSDAVDRASAEFQNSKGATDQKESRVRSSQHDLDLLRMGRQHDRETARAPRGSEWQSLGQVSPEEIAIATHLNATLSNHRMLEDLAAATSATHLVVSAYNDTGTNHFPTGLEAMEVVGKLATLKSLTVHVAMGPVDQAMLKPLANLKGLEELVLHAESWADPACLAELAAFKNCRIHLSGSLDGNPVAGHLKHLAGASELVLDFTGWPAEKGLGEALGNLPNLTRLSLPAASETAAALKAKKLQTVRADRLDADLVRALKAHPAITTLDLTNSNLASGDLALLAELPQLKQLVLSGCLELDEFALPPLRELRSLESIDLTATPVRLWAVRLLQYQMPKVKVLR